MANGFLGHLKFAVCHLPFEIVLLPADCLPGEKSLSPVEQQTPPVPVRRTLSRPNILVVDDDPATQDLLREILGEEGYRVVTLGSGEEALQASEREPFDLIISDLNLGPDLNGIDVLRAYKSVQPESEVILITALPHRQLDDEANSAGAFCLLRKPFETRSLLDWVERSLLN